MRSVKAPWCAVAAGLALFPVCARGAGYSIYEQGAAVLGMAGAGVASVSDPSAVFFNPAAMSRLDGTQLLVGGTLLNPVTSFAGVAPYPGYGVTEEMERQSFFPPTIYATHHLSHELALGAGFDSPYGLGVKWKNPDQFTGRYIVTEANLHNLSTNLSLSYARGPKWSGGLGLDLVFAKVDLHRREQAVLPGGGGVLVDVARVDLNADYKSGWGWNAGLSFAPDSDWTLAATFRSLVVTKPSGDATFTQMPTGNAVLDAAVAASLPPNQGVSSVIRFPATWSGAAAYRPQPNWTIEADANFFQWSVFKDLPIYLDQTPSANQTLVENYKDSWQFRFGTENRLPRFTWRFGYYYDQQAAPDESVTPILPDANRNGLSAGLGFALGAKKQMTLDLYELAVFVDTRSTNGVERDGYNGEYKSYVNAAGFGLTYRW